MSLLEIAAVALLVINILLLVVRSIWNYPVGMAGVALSGLLFLREHLYGDAALQLFFFVLQIYGWWTWSRASAAQGEVRVERLGSRARLMWAFGLVLAGAAWGSMLERTDDPFPHLDAAVTVASVAAQLLMSWRYLENWWLWILVDLVGAALYALKGLWAMAALSVLLAILAVVGERKWRTARDPAGGIA